MTGENEKPRVEDKGGSSQVALINAEIKNELSDPAVGRALLATTFKKLSELNMRKAILEGRLRGYTFKEFLEKDVYALPYGDGYSLVTSIGRARKIGARSGVSGESPPTYTDKDGKIETCSLTVYKKNGDERGYTATVYFDEYYKEGKTYQGKYTPSMWDTKPRTMIAKVAEMHALRKACPEDLSQDYVEEEFQREEVPEPRRVISTEVENKPKPTIGSITKKKGAKNDKEINSESSTEEEVAETSESLFGVTGGDTGQET